MVIVEVTGQRGTVWYWLWWRVSGDSVEDCCPKGRGGGGYCNGDGGGDSSGSGGAGEGRGCW